MRGSGENGNLLLTPRESKSYLHALVDHLEKLGFDFTGSVEWNCRCFMPSFSGQRCSNLKGRKFARGFTSSMALSYRPADSAVNHKVTAQPWDRTARRTRDGCMRTLTMQLIQV